MVLEGNMLIDDLENLPQITIAAVNGPARGSGVEISLACDIRYAAASASFQQHEADMGGFPGGGAPLRLPMLVGYARPIEQNGRASCRERVFQSVLNWVAAGALKNKNI